MIFVLCLYNLGLKRGYVFVKLLLNEEVYIFKECICKVFS